jgi:aryl-alcohol dehydrogenase-like predicted oxidoreductase
MAPRNTTLGRTGLTVSRLALGTAALGLEYGIPQPGQTLRPDPVSAERLLERALELGVTLLDTARAYGESEAIIGRALASRRSEFTLATKVAAAPGDPQRVRESVEASLRALRTGVLDIVQIHCTPQETKPDPTTTDVLLECRDRGWIRFLGVSVYGTEVALAALQSGHFDVLQVAYNALDRRVAEHLLPAAGDAGAGVLARSVLLKGALTGRYLYLDDSLNPLKAQVRQLEAIAVRESLTLPELAYRFVWGDPRVHCALSGAASIGELESTMDWVSRGPLPAHVVSEIGALEMLGEQQLSPAHWKLE